MQRAIQVAGIAALLSLLLFVQVDGNSAWLRVVLDGTHVPVFAGVAALLAVMLRRRGDTSPDGQRYLRAFVLALGLGLAIEFVQSQSGRPASSFDVGSNAAGAAIGLALLAFHERTDRRRPLTRPAKWILVFAAIAGLVFASWRPLEAARAYLHRAQQLPLVAAFGGPLDLYFVDIQGLTADIVALPSPWARVPGERALRIRYDATRAPAVQVSEPWADWEGYRTLAIDVTNAGDDELNLVLRILDATHDWSHEDRLNLSLAIPPATRTTVRVPLDAVRAAPVGRTMNLSRIANVMLFGRDPAGAGQWYVSRLWLE